jgi:hypothetical protein
MVNHDPLGIQSIDQVDLGPRVADDLEERSHADGISRDHDWITCKLLDGLQRIFY